MTALDTSCDSTLKVWKTLWAQERHKDLLLSVASVALTLVTLLLGSFFLGRKFKTRPPRYWANQTWSIFDDNYEQEVDVTTELREAMQRLLDMTTNRGAIGRGRDSVGLTHKGFRVLRVTRIENGKLWSRYKHIRKRMAIVQRVLGQMAESWRTHTENALRLIAREQESKLKDPLVAEFFRSLELDASRNEHMLFHGCPGAGARDESGGIIFETEAESPVHAVKRQGFDDRLGSVKGMYGSGSYFADMASKADQYGGRYNSLDSPTGSVGERATMFLARVLLGCPYLTNQSLEQLRRPPCVHGHFDLSLSWNEEVRIGRPWREKGVEFKVCDHPRFDSVMGDLMIEGERKIYREYVVYEKQCYPEFCVLYERVA